MGVWSLQSFELINLSICKQLKRARNVVKYIIINVVNWCVQLSHKGLFVVFQMGTNVGSWVLPDGVLVSPGVASTTTSISSFWMKVSLNPVWPPFLGTTWFQYLHIVMVNHSLYIASVTVFLLVMLLHCPTQPSSLYPKHQFWIQAILLGGVVQKPFLSPLGAASYLSD